MNPYSKGDLSLPRREGIPRSNGGTVEVFDRAGNPLNASLIDQGRSLTLYVDAPTRTFWPLTPDELRGLADECEKRSGHYVELLDTDPGFWVKVKLDDEAGGDGFVINNEGRPT